MPYGEINVAPLANQQYRAIMDITVPVEDAEYPDQQAAQLILGIEMSFNHFYGTPPSSDAVFQAILDYLSAMPTPEGATEEFAIQAWKAYAGSQPITPTETS